MISLESAVSNLRAAKARLESFDDFYLRVMTQVEQQARKIAYETVVTMQPAEVSFGERVVPSVNDADQWRIFAQELSDRVTVGVEPTQGGMNIKLVAVESRLTEPVEGGPPWNQLREWVQAKEKYGNPLGKDLDDRDQYAFRKNPEKAMDRIASRLQYAWQQGNISSELVEKINQFISGGAGNQDLRGILAAIELAWKQILIPVIVREYRKYLKNVTSGKISAAQSADPF